MKTELYWDWHALISKATTVKTLDSIVTSLKKMSGPPDDDRDVIDLLSSAALKRRMLTIPKR